jgi:hypothetical protein
MDEQNDNRSNGTGWRRPPFFGLIAALVGILIGLFVPLSRALRKTGKREK